MRLSAHILFTASLGGVLAGSMAAHADLQKHERQARAAAATPVTKPQVALTVLKSQATPW